MNDLAQPASSSLTPEECLLAALRSPDARARLERAREGLACCAEGLEASADTEALLHRQAYLAHLELGDLGAAVDAALAMASRGSLGDVAEHDASRALAAFGDLDGAIERQRLACRKAPAERRNFHLWSLATLEHFAGRVDSALHTLERALMRATRDRPLLEAHHAFIRLASAAAVVDLDGVIRRLEASKSREGYGGYLLGMIAYQLGDERRATVELRAFLRRNARLDVAKELTLREELRRARRALASIDSD